MTRLALHYDFRAPAFGARPERVYGEALQQCAWADAKGFFNVVISSHHGCDDNYGPAPLIAATAIAARTERLRIAPVLALPLYHPLHVAEEVAVLDLVSRGRIDLILGAGYRPTEFAMFDEHMANRPSRMEEGVAAIREAWKGEPFEFRGERVLVRPRPFQRPGPALVMAGDSRAAARRAARLADAYMPVAGSDSYGAYVEACWEMGRRAPPQGRQPSWMFLHVTLDPERAWRELEPYLLHVNNSYHRWLAEAGGTEVYAPAEDADDLKRSGRFQIVTPAECIELALGVDVLMFDPLYGGMPPELGWESLELAADQVLPALLSET